MVWPLPISLATTLGISFDFFSSAYLDVSVRRVPLRNLCIQLRIRDSSSRGFPHSDIRGSQLISSLPRLFAGYHVLLRLSVPRHSPYALFRLNSSACFVLFFLFWNFKLFKFASCLIFANNCLFWVVFEKTVSFETSFSYTVFPPPDNFLSDSDLVVCSHFSERPLIFSLIFLYTTICSFLSSLFGFQ